MANDHQSLINVNVVIAQLTRRRNRVESQACPFPPFCPRSSLPPSPINIVTSTFGLCLAKHHHSFRVRVQLKNPLRERRKNMTTGRNKINKDTLEDIELPLRHFFFPASESDSDNQDDSGMMMMMLLPVPAPSIRDQTIQINFETPLHRTITLSLSVDAGPGCGGIAWPAGKVR